MCVHEAGDGRSPHLHAEVQRRDAVAVREVLGGSREEDLGRVALAVAGSKTTKGGGVKRWTGHSQRESLPHTP